MKILTLSVALAVLTLGSSTLIAQQESPEAGSEAAVSQWVQQLGDDDYSKREAASKALKGLGEKARSALQQARDSKNLEQRQRVLALLGELDAPVSPRGDAANGLDRLRAARDQRRQRLQRGVEVRPSRRSQRLRRVRPAPSEPLEPVVGADTQSALDEIQRRLEALGVRDFQVNRRGSPGSPFAPDPRIEIPFMNMRGQSTTKTMTINGADRLELTQSEKDGVSLKVTSRNPATGVTTEEVHVAPSMEEFKERFPELVEKHRDSGVFDMGMKSFTMELPGLGTGAFGLSGPLAGPGATDWAKLLEQMRNGSAPGTTPRTLRGSLNRLVPTVPLTPEPSSETEFKGPKLGVVLSPVPSLLRAHVELPEKAVIVEEVQPGSVAQTMGLKAHDVISKVNGVAVGDAFDVRKLLQSAEESVEVLVHRKGQTQTLSGKLNK